MQTIIPEKYNTISKPMTVVFENNEKIITHPSGVISKYNKEDIQRSKDNFLEQKTRIEDMILLLDGDLDKLGVVSKVEPIQPVSEPIQVNDTPK